MDEKDIFLQRLGLHLKNIRLSKGLSIRDIELNHDVNRSFISEVENGKLNFTIYNLKRIADIYELELTELFKGFTKDE